MALAAAILAVLATPIAGAEQARAAEGTEDLLLDARQLTVLQNSCRPEAIERRLRVVAALGNRAAGEAGLSRTADWLESVLRALGFRIWPRQRFSVTVPREAGSRITCRGADGTELSSEVFAFWPNYVTPSWVPAAGLRGPLVYVGAGRLSDFDGKPIAGRGGAAGAVVLMDYESRAGWLNAAGLGAGAVVFLSAPDASYIESLDKFTQTPIQFARFYVDDPERSALLKRAAAVGSEATLTGGMRWSRVEAENVLAFLPATDPAEPCETLLLCINYDAAALIPGVAHGGQSASNLATALEMLRVLVDPALGLKRRHNVLVLFDSARTMSTAGLREFAGVVRDVNARRRRRWRASGGELTNRQRFIIRKMADIEPWIEDWQGVCEVQRGRVSAAAAWLKACAGGVVPFDYEDEKAVSPSELIPQPDARRWLTTLLSERAKQAQIGTISETASLERAEGANQFTPDAQVSPRLRTLRVRKRYYRHLTARETPEALVRFMTEEPLAEAARTPDDVTCRSLLAELEARLAELQGRMARLETSLALRERIEELDITRAFAIDVSSGDTMLTLSREIGSAGDRTSPSKQLFEWHNALAPLIRRNLEHISLLADHAVREGRAEGERTFDFLGRGDVRRQASPAPHGAFDADLALAGVSSVTFVTGNDHRLQRMGPGNRVPLDARSLRNLSVQSRTLALLLAHLVQEPGLVPHYERNTPWCLDVSGLAVKQDVRAGPFPKLPVPEAIMVIPAKEQITGSVFNYRFEQADSEGFFRFAGVAGGVVEGSVQGFRVGDSNGMIAYAPDERMATRGGYETGFSRLDRSVFKRVVLFEGACVQLYGAIDPMLMQPLATPVEEQTRLLEGKGGNFDSQYLFRPETPASTLLAVVPPRSRLKCVIGLQGFGKRMLLLGDQEHVASGEGFNVGDGLNLTMTGRYAAQDLWRLNDSRLRKLAQKGVRSNVARRLHREATEDLPKLDEASEQNRYAMATYLARGIWGRELRAYPDILDTTNEAIIAVVILLAFLAPWAVFMERIFLQSGSIRGRIAGTVGFFAVAFFVIYFMHPAFQISQTPIMILVAYTLASLAALAAAVLISRYSTVMRKWREQVGGIHASDISRAGAFTVAFNLGLSNMAKRRTRTILMIAMIGLLSFSVMTFTSVESYIDTRRVPVQGAGRLAYDGVLFRLHNWGTIDEETATNFVRDLGPGVGSVRRMWYTKVESGYAARIGGTANRFLFELGGEDASEAGRYHTANVLLGFMPEETEFSGLDRCVTGRWLSGARDEVILPDVAARALGIAPDSVRDATAGQEPRVQFGKERLRVVGILDSASADRLIGLGGTNLGHVDFFLSGIAPPSTSQELARALTQPVGDEMDIRFVPFAKSAILPYDLLRELGGRIKAVVGRFPAGVDAGERVDELMSRAAMNIYASSDGKPYLVKTASSQSVEGAWKMLLPLLLVILIMVNMMLGTVDERQEEIKMLGAVGLAPRHVTILYLAESCAFGVLGVVFGAILGLAVALLTRNVDVGVDVNYASVSTMFMGIFVLAVVIVATLIPARRAARLATPSGSEEWSLPDAPEGAVSITLPFTMTRDNGVGIFAFLYEYMDSHWDSTSDNFRCTELRAAVEERDGGESALTLRSRLWLAPYDMRVSQDMVLELRQIGTTPLFGVTYSSTRRTGELNAWQRANFEFIDLLRQQFLIYRTVAAQHGDRYLEHAQRIFAEAR
jgi:hypothetical protein